MQTLAIQVQMLTKIWSVNIKFYVWGPPAQQMLVTAKSDPVPLTANWSE